MQIQDWVFFVTTSLLLADSIFSLFYIGNSLENYNLENQARFIKNVEIKQTIVNAYVKDYGIFRSIIKVFGGMVWHISGVFTQLYFIVVGLFILRLIYRIINRDNTVGEVTYFFRIIFFISMYIYILNFYSHNNVW